MYDMFWKAEAFNQPLDFDTARVTNVRAYMLVWSLITLRDQILISFFLAIYYQMDWMFEATSFNQPLDFNTSKVTSVRAYICVESDHHERPDADFICPTRFRWKACFMTIQSSINN